MLEEKTKRRIESLLDAKGFITEKEKEEYHSFSRIEKIQSDGSTRQFFRIVFGEKRCVGVLPATDVQNGLREAQSAIKIGSHLVSQKLAVPQILGADHESGLILFEDCGDLRLHDFWQSQKKLGADPEQEEKTKKIYLGVIKALVKMQWLGRCGFDVQWCYDTQYYDKKLMMERESNYFLNVFWRSLLRGEEFPAIQEEFSDIADHAGQSDNRLFLHRDFQSRNIMVCGEEIKIIDFQGGRIGPGGYDLASLLIDPYCALSPSFQEFLVKKYLSEAIKYGSIDENSFRKNYIYLKLQRNLQIVGAFSFLYKVRNKLFFKQFIQPSLKSLAEILGCSELQKYTVLQNIVRKADKKIKSIL